MLRSAVRRRSLVAHSDDALAREAAAGGVEAFGELYRRHSGAAWGVAQAIVRNPDDASDAVAEAFTKVLKTVVGAPDTAAEALRFRPYLLTATRHAAIDVLRRRAWVEPAEDIEEAAPVTGPAPPVDQVVAREEEAIAVEVFGRLPERWRTALWLIDVERLSTRDAAEVLGVEPNNAAQLAARGRARLREQFLQAHVPNHIQPVCQDVVSALGGYLAGTASPTRRAEVDSHLAVCSDCADRLAHVRDLGITLRRAILPVPLLLGRRISRSLGRAVEGASAVDAPAASILAAGGRLPLDSWGAVVGHLSAASPAVERLIVGVSAAALVVGVSTAAVKSQDNPDQRPAVAAAAAPQQGGGASLGAPAFPSAPSDATGGRAADAPPAPARVGTPAATQTDGTSRPAVPTGVLPADAGLSDAVPALAQTLSTAHPLVGPTLRGVNLAGADLARAVVPGPDLSGANLSGARLIGTDLSGALLSGANMAGSDGAAALLRGSDLTRTTLTGANLSGADLTGTLARSANLSGADLTGTLARSANLSGADLTQAILAGADLRGADLRNADLTRANLTGANLSGANLAGADLTSAVLGGATLTDAVLTGTRLVGTGLEQVGAAVPAPPTVQTNTAPVLPALPVPAPGSATLPAVPVPVPAPGSAALPAVPAPAVAPLAGPPPLPAVSLPPAPPVPAATLPPVPAGDLVGTVAAVPAPALPSPVPVPAPVAAAVPVNPTTAPAPLLGGPLLPGVGGILTNSPLSPLLGVAPA